MTDSLRPSSSLLPELRGEIARRASRLVEDARIDEDLRRHLRDYLDVVRTSRALRKAHPAGDWESLYLLIGMTEGAAQGGHVLDAAAAFELYGLSITLFDAVQDAELYPPFTGEAGANVAINAALVLFLLACDGVAWLDLPRPTAARVRASFMEHSLVAGSAQHQDVLGRRPDSVADAVRRAQGKTSLHAMICEVAAILAGAPADRVAAYRRIGEQTARLRQMANDIRGIFGANESVDLELGKWTLPFAVFASSAAADEVAQLDALVRAKDLTGVRALLLSSGAIQRTATMMDRTVREIGDEADALGLRGGPMDLFLEFVDAFAASLYRKVPRATAAAVAS